MLIKTEHNARIHLVATIAALALGVVVKLRSDEWLGVTLAIGLVWLAEAMNTAIERLADAITLGRDARIGAAKDVAAAGVLFVSMTALIIGLVIFSPHMIDMLR